MDEKRHIYFLGIGGTLMGSLAQLAQDLGYRVTGSDKAVYPPMSDQLADAGIEVYEGFDPDQLDPAPDEIVLGNAGLPRGNDAIEYILERGLPYTSGAQWLGERVLRDRWVIAVAGTHGKTTTASMIAHVLTETGLDPGYLIGGAPLDLGRSARLGQHPFFVVEADEYDTSYFDRRSKFVHYRPRTVVLNNLEYDHADIFPDIAAIQTQFHHLLRTVPGGGLIVAPTSDEHIEAVLNMGCWTPVARVGDGLVKRSLPQDGAGRWRAVNPTQEGNAFDVSLDDQTIGRVDWGLLGKHNQHNGLAALAVVRHAGVKVEDAVEALSTFSGVKRRLEVIYEDERFTLYDDFAHHPTAIRTTLEGLRKAVGSDEIIGVVEPRTHTMSLGALQDDLATCCAAADRVLWFRGENLKWDLADVVQRCVVPSTLFDRHEALTKEVLSLAAASGANNKRTHVVIMSNGGFGGIYKTLVEALSQGG